MLLFLLYQTDLDIQSVDSLFELIVVIFGCVLDLFKLVLVDHFHVTPCALFLMFAVNLLKMMCTAIIILACFAYLGAWHVCC